MSLYIEQIRQLVALHHVDDGIHAVNAELEAAPQEVENLQKRFNSQDAQRNLILDKLQHIQEQQKRLDADIQDDESRLVNSKNKLMQVENDREYQAMIREMDTMERQNQTREEERMALQEERSLQESNLHSVEDTWNELKTELESQRENLEKRLAECRTKLEALEAQRAEVSALISPPVLSRYEFIRNRLRHPVIVPVEAGVCSGCHIAIPPQVFIDLQRGNHIMSCPNCQRLIVWRDDFMADDPEALAAAKAKEMENAAGEDGSSEAE